MEFFTLLQTSTTLALTTTFVLGLCVGSFLNVVIHRTPLIMKYRWRKECVEFFDEQADFTPELKDQLKTAIANDTPISLSYPPSRCPKCSHQIRAHENIPVLSWLVLLRGKCSGCGNPISMRYPLVELITALLSVLVIYTLGANLVGVLGLIYLWILIALTGIDFDTKLLPDSLVFPLGMVGILANTQGIFTSPTSAILGGLFGFLFFWGVAKIYALIRRIDGLGAGDFKLLGAIGAWLGVGMLPLLVLISAVFGSVVGIALMIKRGESRTFAFGPYIAIAGVIALLWGHDLMTWYLNLYKM